MHERYGGRLRPDMDVCDVNGDKVGTLAHVYRREPAASGAADAAPALPGEELLEVKTGLLGLGAHYYVPLSAVEDVTSEGVFLSRAKDEFEQLGWAEKPPYLDELR